MILPVFLPMLASTIHTKPSKRKDKPETGKNNEQVGLRKLTRRDKNCGIACQGGTDKGPEIRGSLPIEVDLEFAYIERMLKSFLALFSSERRNIFGLGYDLAHMQLLRRIPPVNRPPGSGHECYPCADYAPVIHRWTRLTLVCGGHVTSSISLTGGACRNSPLLAESPP